MPLDFTKGSISLDYAEGVAAGALVDDMTDSVLEARPAGISSAGFEYDTEIVAAGARAVIATKAMNFAANSRAVAVASMAYYTAMTFKLEVVMDGVTMATSAFLLENGTVVVVGIKALVGVKTVLARIWNDDAAQKTLYFCAVNVGKNCGGMLGVGSVKLA